MDDAHEYICEQFWLHDIEMHSTVTENINIFTLFVKVSLLCAMKGSYFDFGSPQQQV